MRKFVVASQTFPRFFLLHAVSRHDSPVLSDLDLFDEAPSSALTFLRIFTARSFMIDVDKIYGARRVRHLFESPSCRRDPSNLCFQSGRFLHGGGALQGEADECTSTYVRRKLGVAELVAEGVSHRFTRLGIITGKWHQSRVIGLDKLRIGNVKSA